MTNTLQSNREGKRVELQSSSRWGWRRVKTYMEAAGLFRSETDDRTNTFKLLEFNRKQFALWRLLSSIISLWMNLSFSLLPVAQDTAGSERYEAMSRIYYRGARAAIVCYGKSTLFLLTLLTAFRCCHQMFSVTAAENRCVHFFLHMFKRRPVSLHVSLCLTVRALGLLLCCFCETNSKKNWRLRLLPRALSEHWCSHQVKLCYRCCQLEPSLHCFCAETLDSAQSQLVKPLFWSLMLM